MCLLQVVLIASFPVFVNSSVPPPGPDPRWQAPASTGPGCVNASACYNATTLRKWYGTVSSPGLGHAQQLDLSRKNGPDQTAVLFHSVRIARFASFVGDNADMAATHPLLELPYACVCFRFMRWCL